MKPTRKRSKLKRLLTLISCSALAIILITLTCVNHLTSPSTGESTESLDRIGNLTTSDSPVRIFTEDGLIYRVTGEGIEATIYLYDGYVRANEGSAEILPDLVGTSFDSSAPASTVGALPPPNTCPVLYDPVSRRFYYRSGDGRYEYLGTADQLVWNNE